MTKRQGRRLWRRNTVPTQKLSAAAESGLAATESNLARIVSELRLGAKRSVEAHVGTQGLPAEDPTQPQVCLSCAEAVAVTTDADGDPACGPCAQAGAELEAARARLKLPRDDCADAAHHHCKGRASFHYACTECGAATCRYMLRVEAGTLRRRRSAVCTPCSYSQEVMFRDSTERTERTRRDWLYITDPIVMEKIRLGVLPEQFPSHVRAVLRAFYESHRESAVVELDGVTPGSLNQSIAALGLHDVMYAEQRSGQPVLRRMQGVPA